MTFYYHWINPLLALIPMVLGGHSSNSQSIFFTIAALILMMCASVNTWQNQLSFKYSHASNVVPVAQVPIKIVPLLVYFFILALIPPSSISVIYILLGTILTIVAGFLPVRRQESFID